MKNALVSGTVCVKSVLKATKSCSEAFTLTFFSCKREDNISVTCRTDGSRLILSMRSILSPSESLTNFFCFKVHFEGVKLVSQSFSALSVNLLIISYLL